MIAILSTVASIATAGTQGTLAGVLWGTPLRAVCFISLCAICYLALTRFILGLYGGDRRKDEERSNG